MSVIDKLFKKLGYVKSSGFNPGQNIILREARLNKQDVFVDFVKKTGTQKFYVKKNKKNILVYEY